MKALEAETAAVDQRREERKRERKLEKKREKAVRVERVVAEEVEDVPYRKTCTCSCSSSSK